MATIRPFKALRPQPALASQVCELPYDVMSTEEARAVAAGNPLSFLRVSKPEIDLPPGADPYSADVYATGKRNLDELISRGALQQDALPCFYFYRQVMGAHSQTGLVAVASCQEYLDGIIKKHELTRVDKEDDRVRHVETLESQTGPAFLVYRAVPALDQITEQWTARAPEVDFTANDNVRHSAWVVRDEATQARLASEFARIPSLYIADGHHRSAAAARVFQKRQGAGTSGFFLSVIFPHNRVQILGYNRVLKDLNGITAGQLLEKLESIFTVTRSGQAQPSRKHDLSLFLEGEWRTLTFRPEFTRSTNPVETLDASLLQRLVLDPVFGITDPRTSHRIQFVGGIRGTGELQKLVREEGFACAFSLYPTSVDDLMSVADAGAIMPPKSTWFEPKLRDAMFCHMLT
jgi:uncharacterized protein (DUF1015 family)